MLEFSCALANLADTASRTVKVLGTNGLDRIDEEQVRMDTVYMLENALGDSLGDDIKFGIQSSELITTLRSQKDPRKAGELL